MVELDYWLDSTTKFASRRSSLPLVYLLLDITLVQPELLNFLHRTGCGVP